MMSVDQWSDADKAKFTKQKRPTITIDRITGIVQTVTGLQRKGRQDIDLAPENPEDAEGAEVMEVLLKWVREQNKLRHVSSRVFDHKIQSGLAFWKLGYDFRRRPQGEISCIWKDPLNVYWDPNFPDSPWEEIEWVMDASWYSMDQAIEDWEDYEERIRQKFGEWLSALGQGSGKETGDSKWERRAFWDAQTQRVRILQVWYKTLEHVKLAVFKDGEVWDDAEKVDALEAALSPEDRSYVAVTTRPVIRTRVAHLLDDIILDDRVTPLPFQDFPIVPALGYYYWKKPFGLVDLMKDPQREKNKRRAVITEIAARTALSGWLNKEGQGARSEDLENYSTGAGVEILYTSEKPEPIRPPQLPEILVHLEEAADKEIREVVNVHDELLGAVTQKTISGRAIEARQQGSLLTQEPLFDTFQEEEAYLHELLIKMIQDLMTEEEAHRIVGSLADMARSNGAAMNGTKPKESVLAMAGDPDLLRSVLGQSFNARYKVTITTRPFFATQARATVATLSDLIQKAPFAAQAFLPLIISKMGDSGELPPSDAKKALEALQGLMQQQAAAQQQQEQPGGAPPGDVQGQPV